MASLTLRTTRIGSIVQRFYCKFTDEKGTVRVVALTTKFEGTPPASGRLRDPGDAKFEKARHAAQLEANAFAEKARDRKIHIYAMRKLVELRQGAITETRIADLPKLVMSEPNFALLSKQRQDSKRISLADFCAWCASRHLVFATEVSRALATEYIRLLGAADSKGRAYSRGSIKDRLTPLRTAFGMRGVLPDDAANPFVNNATATARAPEPTVSRTPLSREEEKRLLENAKQHRQTHDIILTALHTGQRRGDIFGLRWENVDLQKKAMHVRQSKTGAVVWLPLSRELFEVLSRIYSKKQRDEAHVFPEAASHKHRAGARIDAVFRETFGTTSVDSGKNKRAANTRGMHSLRTTFISRRLTEGWTIEQVSLFTGHSSAQVVYKHYHKASALDLRDKLEESLAKK